jgi:hypothetical protein
MRSFFSDNYFEITIRLSRNLILFIVCIGFSLPTPRPLHYRPIRNPHISKYIKRGKYKIFRTQSYTKIRSPINKTATIAGKNINSDTTQHMIGHSKNLTTEINRQYNYRKRPSHNEKTFTIASPSYNFNIISSYFNLIP